MAVRPWHPASRRVGTEHACHSQGGAGRAPGGHTSGHTGPRRSPNTESHSNGSRQGGLGRGSCGEGHKGLPWRAECRRPAPLVTAPGRPHPKGPVPAPLYSEPGACSLRSSFHTCRMSLGQMTEVRPAQGRGRGRTVRSRHGQAERRRPSPQSPRPHAPLPRPPSSFEGTGEPC